MANNKVILLVDEIGVGKTTALMQWIDRRDDVAGILTPVVNGERMFYSISDKSFFEMLAPADDASSLQVGKYFFSATAFKRANELIHESAGSQTIKYLIIDEIGPLELNKQQGFWPVLQFILGYKLSPLLVIVVRNSTASELERLFKENMFSVNSTNTVCFAEVIEQNKSPDKC
jgi:nucleoside-triphosphatase THEP1